MDQLQIIQIRIYEFRGQKVMQYVKERIFPLFMEKVFIDNIQKKIYQSFLYGFLSGPNFN